MMSLREMERATGISCSMLSRIFSDDPKQRRSPSLKNAKKICDAVGVTLDVLYDVLET